MPSTVRILIVTVADDIHAAAVRQHLDNNVPGDCQILEVDRMSESHRVRWHAESEAAVATLTVDGVTELDISQLSVIWWRRINTEQSLAGSDATSHDLINRGCSATLRGILATSFRGTWVSHPVATETAANKLVQLAAAQRVGLHVPRTLVSDDPEAVRRFFDECDGNVIAKPVVGSPKEIVFTQSLTAPDLADSGGIGAMPTIYQELIPGSDHLRVNVFGDSVYASTIRSDQLDWRPDVTVPIMDADLDDVLKDQLRALLEELNLRMGVFDLKVDSSNGRICWIEVNPQGQFLFLEGITGIPLTEHFASFLSQLATTHSGG